MRVIGGEFRSRVLKSVPGLDTRPTPDRLREALFNVLAPRIQGRVFADLYAGTGAVGIEALSRGASRAVFVEKSRTALNVIRENVKALGLESRTDIRTGNPSKVLELFRASIVFLDPPYDKGSEYEATLGALGTRPPDLVIAQHPPRFELDERYGKLMRIRVLRQGDNALSFYEVEGI